VLFPILKLLASATVAGGLLSSFGSQEKRVRLKKASAYSLNVVFIVFIFKKALRYRSLVG
jgi:hypothetical protein